MRWFIILLLFVSVSASAQSPATPPQGFKPALQFDESEKWLVNGLGRAYTNLPANWKTDEQSTLVVFACPNGNTIEQTVGCATVPGMDWHFDIQHVGAQMRVLRTVDNQPSRALHVMEAPKLSWPTFRQTPSADATIRKEIESQQKSLDLSRLVLSGHSGGGSLIFGFINAHEKIPENLDRIIFLDANYAYNDDLKHGEKLLSWLNGDASRRLVVIAYDDREITVSGKKVVSDTGGTFRATFRMIDRLKKEIQFAQDKSGEFDHYSAMKGQIEIYIHPNPQNKILHTTLVGEFNGFLQGMTLGTPEEKKWGQFGGPRAYADFVSKKPLTGPARPAATQPTATRPTSKATSQPIAQTTAQSPSQAIVSDRAIADPFKARPEAAVTGSVFASRIAGLPIDEQQQAIAKEILSGNVPPFLRQFVAISDEIKLPDGSKHTIQYWVSADVLSIGSDADFLRIPMTPMTAQLIASQTGCSMITRKISDAVYVNAAQKCEPKPMTKEREAVQTFVQHNQIIEEQRGKAPLGQLRAGIKKDVVLTNRLSEKPNKVAIYGWHLLTGKAIQPLYVGHKDMYVDYSHGIRLVSQRVIVDGKPMMFEEVLKDKALSALISDEGPITSKYKAMELK